MFRRLAITFGLLVALSLLGLALGIVTLVGPGEERQSLLVLLGAAGALALFGVVLLSAALSRRINRPLRDLSHAIEQMGSGGSRSRAFSADKELSRLDQTFNRASERLETRIAQLEQDRQ